MADFSNTSKDLRPDTVSFDHKTVFTLGPVAVADVTQGVISYPWYVRHDVDSMAMYYARANDANDAWMEETLLFTYDGNPLVEIDAAFDQAGRIFVCGERDGEIWAYYFNPLIPGFSFELLGEGRTPKAILDNPRDTGNSDVLLFYMNDGEDCLCFRAQKDRYQTEYTTPVTLVQGKYTEDATRTKTNRIQIYYSERNFVTGRYAMKVLLSTLYPYMSDPDMMLTDSMLTEGGELVMVVIESLMDTEFLLTDGSLEPGGTLAEPLIVRDFSDTEAIQADSELQDGGTLEVSLIVYSMFDKDMLQINSGLQSGGALIAVVISYTFFDKEQMQINSLLQPGGTLEVP